VKKDELQIHNGKDGNKAYVSYKGKIYDVTGSRLWKNGKHVNRHEAGMDLTEGMDAAPHGMDVLERFEQVGSIDGFRVQKEAGGSKEMIKKLYRMFHPHPMLIHFPMGLLGFTVIMQLIFFYNGDKSFELAGFYSLVTAVVFMLPTILSGIVSWWVNYELAMTKIFIYKLSFSIILFVMGIIELVIRFSAPEVSSGTAGISIFYNVMIFANIPVLAVVGFNGGKLSWG
jgi:predicted heme/steroid binding protein/uncharacterized membrane protein